MAPQVVVPLQAINPVIPREEKRKEELKEDLLRMGCRGLLLQLWDLKDEDMVGELLHE